MALAAALVGACSFGGPGVEAAPRAGDPACSVALAAAPAQVAGRPRTPLDVAGALAWGEPAVVARCGLPPVGTTTLQCVSANGLDWVVDPAGDPVLATTYGRDPAMEVRVPAAVGGENVLAALVDLAPVAKALPGNGRRCQD